MEDGSIENGKIRLIISMIPYHKTYGNVKQKDLFEYKNLDLVHYLVNELMALEGFTFTISHFKVYYIGKTIQITLAGKKVDLQKESRRMRRFLSTLNCKYLENRFRISIVLK